jgi:chemosensory pili system protein ChpA (sensor histidine kinase/response regulator)
MTIPDETFSALEAEVAALIDVLLEAFADPEAMDDPAIVAGGLARYRGQVERIGALADAGGLAGLSRVCGLFRERVSALALAGNPVQDRQRELLEEWPGLTIGYLSDPADAASGEALVDHLRDPAWPMALSELDTVELLARLAGSWQPESEGEMIAVVPDRAGDDEPTLVRAEAVDADSVGPASLAGQEAADAFIAPDEIDRPGAVESEKPLDLGLAVAVPDRVIEADSEPAADSFEQPEPDDAEIAPMGAMAEISAEPEIQIQSPDAAAAVADIGSPEPEVASAEREPAFAEPVFSLAEAVALAELEAESVEGVAESLEPRGAPVEIAPEPAATEVAWAAEDAECAGSESDVEAVEPEPAGEDAGAQPPAGFDQELAQLLRAELGSIEEASAELEAVATDPDGDAEARREALSGYAEAISRFADAAEAMGFVGLQLATHQVHGNVQALASRGRALSELEYRLIAGWPAPAMGSLQAVADRDACRALVDHLRQTGWPNPLPVGETDALADLLVAPTLAVPEHMAEEARPREASADDVSLALPEDVNPELLDSLLQELPAQTAELSAAVQRLAGGEGGLRDVEVAQRIAHTVKGAGNTVGVRGIANLTHQMEDILVALSKRKTLPNRGLADALLSASDCLESMCEALLGLSPPPPQGREVLQAILDWANRTDREGLAGTEEAAPLPRPAKTREDASGLADFPETVAAEAPAATVEAKAEPAGPVPMLRVPASLVDELLRLVGESIILTGQIQERARKALRQAKAVQAQHQVFQRLTADLEQLVEIRGIAPLRGRSDAGQGDFDALELEQYNELNTVTHRLLEAAADSRALDQDIREDLTTLDNLLVTQGRLHRESQESVLRTRMVPVKTIVPRLHRSVRQTCRLTDKDVNFTVRGDETLMDGNLLADITDPLMHVLRNAIDHGIETPERRRALGKNPAGRIDLSFFREGDTIVVRCRDDGSGLDFAAIRQTARRLGLIAAEAAPSEAELSQLILASGFTTRAETTQTSGRGIGLDAVHTRLQELRGSLQIRSETDRGCQVEMRLPVTLIAIHALLVRVHRQRFAVSSRGVQQVLYGGAGEIRQLGAKTVFQLGDEYYEFSALDALLGLAPDRRATERQIPGLLLIREGGGTTRAVLVQEILDSRDLVVKPLGRYFPKLGGIIGATILGDGSVVPVLDLPELLRVPTAGASDRPHPDAARPAQALSRPARHSALVVDDSLSARRALALAVEDAGLEVRTARDGLEAVAMIDAHRPDLLLVDLEMPRMNGLELTAHVRAREATRHLPVIMVTSRSTAKHRREAEAMGVNYYLTKPFAEDELHRMIVAALRIGAPAVAG